MDNTYCFEFSSIFDLSVLCVSCPCSSICILHFLFFYIQSLVRCFMQRLSHAIELLLFVDSRTAQIILASAFTIQRFSVVQTMEPYLKNPSNSNIQLTHEKFNSKRNFVSRIVDVLIALEYSIVCWMLAVWYMYIECAEMFDRFVH